jgi:peptidyl-prolyl cis-trans isomerase A (cyclophilin A)
MPIRPAALLALLSVLFFAASPAWAQKVRLATNLGDIVVELDAEKAPKTTENFLRYVRDRHYDGTIFHRVIGTFMIQGGGYRADLSEKPTRAPIPLESANGLSNHRGTLAMARTEVPDSATSQFFINVVDNPGLDKANARDGQGYAVFGKVVEGLDVVDKIKAVAVRENGPHRHFPVETVTLRKATLEK